MTDVLFHDADISLDCPLSLGFVEWFPSSLRYMVFGVTYFPPFGCKLCMFSWIMGIYEWVWCWLKQLCIYTLSFIFCHQWIPFPFNFVFEDLNETNAALYFVRVDFTNFTLKWSSCWDCIKLNIFLAIHEYLIMK